MTLKYDHLLGLPYVPGSTDCYGIVRRFYHDNFGIEMKDYARPAEWWDHGLNLYMDHFHAEGFRVVDVPLREVRPGDGFLIAVRSKVPNHAAVYVGDNQILHHPQGRFSTVEPYAGIWRNFTCAIVRHKDVPDLRQKTEVFDLATLLPEHVKRKVNEEAPELLQ